MAKRPARQKTQLPTCYYEGYLEKRSFKDKTSRKLWTCLCGNTLFFFNDKRDSDYVEKLDLGGLISVTDDSSQDRNLDAARLNLQMEDGNIKFTVPTAEARELWKGYIHSVAELSVPASLNLLPGQIHVLKEVVEKERERTKNVSAPIVTNSMPACYHSVSRLEAELLLEREAKRGNLLLLRPGSDGNSFAVTTRQDLDSSLFKHYRVTCQDGGGFIIDVDNPVPCATLHDVVNYLVEKTDGVFIPLNMEETYEKNISFLQADKENGEKSVQRASTSPVPPSLPPKPAPRIPTPGPAPALFEEECIYMNDDELTPKVCVETAEEKENKAEDSAAVPPPAPEKNAPKKAMMPPVALPRKLGSSASSSSSTSTSSSSTSTSSSSISTSSSSTTTFISTSSSSTSSSTSTSSSSTSTSSSISTSSTNRMRTHSDSRGQIPLAAISELKLKLEQKAKCAE